MTIHSPYNNACVDWRRWMRPGWVCELSEEGPVLTWIRSGYRSAAHDVHICGPQYGESAQTHVYWMGREASAAADPELSNIVWAAMVAVESAE